jgi:histidinol dehydrogenase
MRTVKFGVDDLTKVLERSSIDYAGVFPTVQEIIASVRTGGDAALRQYTKKFDGIDLDSIRVSKAEVERAYEGCESRVLRALKKAHRNIKAIHTVQHQGFDGDWMYDVERGVCVGERMTPIESVGCYVPGGRAAYPSTVLMCATPAKIAGVKRIVVVSPPKIPDVVLAACRVAGVDEVYRVGGAQAVAALAFGTESIKRVGKIVGPGNRYVTAAKMLVYGTVDIDMPAGPSEIMILADKGANPAFIAADILAQAEHDPNAQCVLATDSKKLIDDVIADIQVESRLSEKREILKQSLENLTIVQAKSPKEMIDFANMFAPEHLEIHMKGADAIQKRIRNAGAIFVGPYSPVAAGDYASGGNHVLPTGGAARYSSQLSVRDYMKSTSIQKITKEGLKRLAPTITALAEKEGLSEHKRSVEARFSE